MNYREMFQKYVNGEITEAQWVIFCQDYFLNVVLTEPFVVEILTRLKNR